MCLPARIPHQDKANRPALNVIDTGIRFNTATFVNGESATEIWNAFLTCWSCMYTGMSTSMLVDKGSVFLSDQWISACELNAIELVATGTESHNSLGPGESYHAYLRRTYNRIHKEYSNVPDEIVQALSI